ncbi:MAG: S41 family peptidase, partial [Novosphingobium sp.]
MRARRFPTLLALAATLASCGGGGGSSGGGGPIGGAPTPTPTAPALGCTLAERQSWVLGQMNEWYLFPSLLDASVNPAAHASVQSYIDALVAPARAQSRDRYFTYITSIADENAFFNSGASAGFGIRLSYDSVNRRLFVMEAYEGAPALAAGIDRGTEVLAIGTSPSTLQTVTSLFASGGSQAVSDALGPSTAGTARTLTVRTGGVDSTITVTKATYTITPVSARYGAKVFDDAGRKIGYINLRTFIDTADPALRNAFASFKAQGVTQLIVDVRYNGGGLVSIAELFSDLMNAGRAPNVLSYTTFRPEKSAYNETQPFTNRTEAVAATKIAFIGTGSSASASELIINAQTPYLGANSALIGSNTYGKPVCQIGLDKATCDDRLRVVAFKTENASHQGDYYT